MPRSTGWCRRPWSGRASSRPAGGVLDAARAVGVPVTTRGAGTSCAGNAVGPGDPRPVPAPEPDHQHRPGGADRAGRAGRRAGVPAGRGGPVRAAVRAGSVDPQPLHDRRHDRQQRLRPAGAGLRQDRGQHRGAGRDHRVGRAAARSDGRDRPRPVRERSTALDRGRATWARSGPSSAGSAGRCPATAWSTCCRSTGSTSPGSWPAPRAPSA